MAFFSRVGNALRQTVSKQLSFDLKVTANPSIYQAIRCMSSSKLFIGGLSYGTDETSLRDAFGNYGQVVEARVILDRETGRSRGFGFVTYTSSEEASAAIQALDGQDLHGRRVRVNYATDRAPRMSPGYGGGNSYGGPYGGGGGGSGSGFGGYDNAGGNFGGSEYQNNGYGMGGTPGNYNPGGFGSSGGQNSTPGNFGAGGGFDSFASGGNFSSSGGAGGNLSADSRFTSGGFDAGLGHNGGDQFGSNGTNERTDELGVPVDGVFKDDSESGVPMDKEDYEHDYAKRA